MAVVINNVLASNSQLTIDQRGKLQMVSLALSLFGEQILPKLIAKDEKLGSLFTSMGAVLEGFSKVLTEIDSIK